MQSLKNFKKGILPNFVWPLLILVLASSILLLSVSDEVEVTPRPVPPRLVSSKYHLLGTGNRLGTYYPVGHIIVDWINSRPVGQKEPFRTLETNGSIENISLLENGKIAFAMAENRIAIEAYEANEDSKVRIVWPLWPDVLHIIAAENVKNNNLELLSNYPGFLGESNSSTHRTSLEFLQALNITNKVDSIQMHPDRVFSALTSERIGFATVQAGKPNRTVSDALLFYRCSLVSIPENKLENILKNVYTSERFTIPEGYYGQQQPEILTIGIPNMLVASTDTDKELVYGFLRDLIPSIQSLSSRHNAINEITVCNQEAHKRMQSTQIPLHKGTLKFLKEITGE